MSNLKICGYCQEPFTARRSDARFCSSRCKHRHFIKKDAEVESLSVSPHVSPFRQSVYETDNIFEPQDIDTAPVIAASVSVTDTKRISGSNNTMKSQKEKPMGNQDSEEPEEEDRYFYERREVTKEEYEELTNPSPKKQIAIVPSFSYDELQNIKNANKELSFWIKTIVKFSNKDYVGIDKIRKLEEQMKIFMNGWVYKCLPKKYVLYAMFEEWYQRIRKAIRWMDLEGIDGAQMSLEIEDHAKLREASDTMSEYD